MPSAHITLAQLCEIAQVPKDARLVDVEYVSEPDGSLALYSDDGDPNASFHISWEAEEPHPPSTQALLDDIASALRLHGCTRLSLKFIQLDPEGLGYTAAGVKVRGPAPDDEEEDRTEL